MHYPSLFTINAILLAVLIIGSVQLQNIHAARESLAQGAPTTAETQQVVDATASAAVAPDSKPVSSPAPTVAAPAPDPTPLIQGRPSINRGGGDDEEYDD